jgi:hypothetical protein
MSVRSTRGLVTEALTETANVLTDVVTSDSGGGGRVTVSTGGTISCRLDALGGGEGELAERISDRSSHLATLPAGTQITSANDLRINGRGTFEVTAVRENTDEMARFVEVVKRT